MANMYKVQLTFTPQEANILSFKASQLGYNMTKFIKLLVAREVLSETEKYPTFALSKKAIKKIEKAQKEHKEGKTTLLKNIDDLDKL